MPCLRVIMKRLGRATSGTSAQGLGECEAHLPVICRLGVFSFGRVVRLALRILVSGWPNDPGGRQHVGADERIGDI